MIIATMATISIHHYPRDSEDDALAEAVDDVVEDGAGHAVGRRARARLNLACAMGANTKGTNGN